MTDFEQRIGPRGSPSPEPQPIYTHMSWTRPGYKTTPPKKPRAQRQPMERTPRFSRSDDLGPPNRRSPTKLPLSQRITMGDRDTQTLALGNHRVERPLGHGRHGPPTRRGPFLEHGKTRGESSENPHTRTSNQTGGALASPSRPNECSELQAPHFASPSSPVDTSNSTHPDPSRNMHPSRDVDALDHGFTSYPNDAETPLMSQRLKVMSQLPLKDRLAPLVLQNANLRSAYNRHDLHEANHNQGRPSISDKNVDSALTPDVCGSIASSLIATVMQLKEMEPMPCLVPYTNSPVHSKQAEGTTPSLTNSPLTPSSGQNTTSSQAMPSTPLRFPTRSAPNSGPQALQATVHQKDAHASTGTNGASTNSTSPRAYQTSSVAQPKPQGQSAIPIPIPTAYFNNTSFSQTPNLPSRPPSDLTPHEYIKRPADRTGPSWKQPSSPNERPRSRSPPASPSTWHYKNNDRRRGRDTFSPSPPSPRLARSPPTSPSYHRRHQPPPFIPRRSRSPRSRRSPSPRRSRSPPRRRESFYSSSAPRQSTSLYHHGSSPVSRSTREYEYSRIPRERETSISSSPTGVTSGGGGLPNSSKTPRGPYLTKYEREQYLASLRRDDDREGHHHTRRHSNAWENDDPQRQHNRMVVDQITVGDEPVTGRQIRAETRSFQTALPTPPASATSTVDHIMELEQAAYSSDPPPKSVLGPVQASAKGPLRQETLNVNAESDRARTHANNPSEREKTLAPWQPLNNIPGIWLLNEGLGEADIFEHSFDVTKEMALKWHLPLLEGDFVKSVLSDKEPRSKFIRKSLPTVSWKLKCVPLEAANTVRHTLEKPITASELVHRLVQLQSCWPSEGKLLIEVNPGQDIGKTFYAKHLGSDVPFVELNQHVHEGSNLIRFIQLEDMSKHVFILYAISPTMLFDDKNPRQGGPGLDHDFSLGDLQYLLQKSRLNNRLTPEMAPPFALPTANVHISFPCSQVEEKQ